METIKERQYTTNRKIQIDIEKISVRFPVDNSKYPCSGFPCNVDYGYTLHSNDISDSIESLINNIRF